ncbi:hypothetical protein ATSB10_31830 [Dyella thiooxydans]|uniref:Uncharacterized protein n=1 Tax=Dyella thiooxydans TaxID=445710 RepID=A0A160N479_9GAMM|nr:hypothetical protein ATSB10_31830 [Dyella thiooxydans]
MDEVLAAPSKQKIKPGPTPKALDAFLPKPSDRDRSIFEQDGGLLQGGRELMDEILLNDGGIGGRRYMGVHRPGEGIRRHAEKLRDLFERHGTTPVPVLESLRR